jgi:threonine/homoserine/homoserine lactone efflux protein
MTDPLLFLVATLSLLAAPGPTNVLLATAGVTAGIRPTLLLLATATLAYLLAVAAARLVLGPVIDAYPLVGVALKVAVALYLGWIAVALWRRSAAMTAEGTVGARDVFVTTLLNPKSLVFAFGIIPQASPILWAYIAAFALLVPLVGVAWIVVGRAVGAASGRQHAGLVRKVASVTLVGFAALLVRSAFG